MRVYLRRLFLSSNQTMSRYTPNCSICRPFSGAYEAHTKINSPKSAKWNMNSSTAAHPDHLATTVLNELGEYFKLPPEEFKRYNPIHWWMGRCAQFPNPFWFVCDLLCIPGVSIIQCRLLCFAKSSTGSAVMSMFSQVVVTLFLCRASLHPETIKVLMLISESIY